MFADDDPGDNFEDEFGNIGGTVDEGTPISANLIYLAVAGMAFAFYYFKNGKKLFQKR